MKSIILDIRIDMSDIIGLESCQYADHIAECDVSYWETNEGEERAEVDSILSVNSIPVEYLSPYFFSEVYRRADKVSEMDLLAMIADRSWK